MGLSTGEAHGLGPEARRRGRSRRYAAEANLLAFRPPKSELRKLDLSALPPAQFAASQRARAPAHSSTHAGGTGWRGLDAIAVTRSCPVACASTASVLGRYRSCTPSSGPPASRARIQTPARGSALDGQSRSWLWVRLSANPHGFLGLRRLLPPCPGMPPATAGLRWEVLPQLCSAVRSHARTPAPAFCPPRAFEVRSRRLSPELPRAIHNIGRRLGRRRKHERRHNKNTEKSRESAVPHSTTAAPLRHRPAGWAPPRSGFDLVWPGSAELGWNSTTAGPISR